MTAPAASRKPLYESAAKVAWSVFGCAPKTLRAMIERGEVDGRRNGRNYVVATYEIERRVQGSSEGGRYEALRRELQKIQADLARVLAELE